MLKISKMVASGLKLVIQKKESVNSNGAFKYHILSNIRSQQISAKIANLCTFRFTEACVGFTASANSG